MHPIVAALLGPEAAAALGAATADRPDLRAHVAPRVAHAWVSGLGDDYDGPVPGGGHLVLAKGENGLAGKLTSGAQVRTYALATHADVAGAVAGALPPEVPGSAKLCAALDGMVRVTSALRKAQALGVLATLAKTSRNVKEQRANITREQADARRERYARTLGLEPVRVAGNSISIVGVPRSSARGKLAPNALPYGGQFLLPHEVGHAMHARRGQTPANHENDLDGQMEGSDHDLAQDEESLINSSLEYKIDRRAGVDPHKFAEGGRRQDRGTVMEPKENEGMECSECDGDDPECDFCDGTGYIEDDSPPEYEPGGWSWEDADDLRNHGDRDESAQKLIGRFDAGQRFGTDGKLRRPTGIDAKINARAGVLKVERPGQAAPPAPTDAPVAPVGPKPPERRNRLPQRPKVPSGQGLAGQTGGAK